MAYTIDTTKTLKLDAGYRPLEVMDSIDALIMCIMDKAIAVENYAKEILTTHKSFYLPAVIILKRIVNLDNITLKCTRKNTCQYCGLIFLRSHLTIDHITPKSRGGINSWLNLVTSCKKCNQEKGARTPEEAEMYPLNTPYKPRPSLLRQIKNHKINEVWKDYLW